MSKVNRWAIGSHGERRWRREKGNEGGDHLTVTLWLGQDRRIVTDWPLAAPSREMESRYATQETSQVGADPLGHIAS